MPPLTLSALTSSSESKVVIKMSVFKRRNTKSTDLHTWAGESSLGHSSASGNKRFFKGSLPSQQQAVVQSSSASRSSRQLRRSREDEYAIYKIDNVDVENVTKLSCGQRTRSFFKTYASVFQMIFVLTILCLPGNIVTVVLQLQSPTLPSRLTARIPKELSTLETSSPMLYVPTTAMGYMVGKSAATMAHTDGYVLPTLPTQSQNPRDIAKTLIDSWPLLRDNVGAFCAKASKQPSIQSSSKTSKYVWIQFLQCNLDQRDEETSMARLQHLFCNDSSSSENIPAEYTQQLLDCVRLTIKRLRDQKPYDEDEYRKNETLKEKDDPYKCVRETEAAQANFTALTKTWPLLSTNQKNFCSQKPFEHGQVWRNYMACVGIKAQKLQPREPEFFVRKMVCQDDNAPECLPDMGICIQELQMELKIMTERKEKGFSLTTTALSQVEKSNDEINDDDAEMCEKWEKWYKNINVYFCPPVLKLIKRNKTLTLKDVVLKELGKGTFNQFLVCQYRMYFNGNTIPNVNRLWQSICVARDFLQGTDECSVKAREEQGFVSQLSSRCSAVKTAKLYIAKEDEISPNMTSQLESSDSTNIVATTMSPLEENFRCHEQYESHMKLVLDLKFWLETVVLSIIATFGFFGNIMTFIVLRKQRSRSNFHKMLMTLTVNDSILIIFYLLSSAVIGSLSEVPTWWKQLFPYVFHPLKAVTFSASIFMVVAVSAERYKAICYPLRHRPSAWQYIAFVFSASVLQNIPKFFEFRLVHDYTDYWTTSLSENAQYVRFRGWWDELGVTGLIPFIALLFFNVCIYRKIRTSTKYRYRFVCRPRLEKQQSTTGKASRAEKVGGHGLGANRSLCGNSAIHAHSEPLENRTYRSSRGGNLTENQMATSLHANSSESRPLMGGEICGHCRNKEARYSSQGSILTPPMPSRMEAVRNPKRIFKRQTTTSEPTLTSDLRPDDLPQVDGYCCGHAYLKLSDGNRCVCLCVQCRDLNCDGGMEKRHQRFHHRSFKVKSRKSVKNEEREHHSSSRDEATVNGLQKTNSTTVAGINGVNGAASCSGGPLENKDGNQVNSDQSINSSLTRYDQDQIRIRKRREKSTIILVAIVLIFLLCHMFRFSLKAYDVTHPSHSTAKHHSYCFMQGKFHVPWALYGLMSANNVLIVFNSSVNFVIYCLVEDSFRAELLSILRSWCFGFIAVLTCCFTCDCCQSTEHHHTHKNSTRKRQEEGEEEDNNELPV